MRSVILLNFISALWELSECSTGKPLYEPGERDRIIKRANRVMSIIKGLDKVCGNEVPWEILNFIPKVESYLSGEMALGADFLYRDIKQIFAGVIAEESQPPPRRTDEEVQMVIEWVGEQGTEYCQYIRRKMNERVATSGLDRAQADDFILAAENELAGFKQYLSDQCAIEFL